MCKTIFYKNKIKTYPNGNQAIPQDIYKPGSAAYYREALWLIHAVAVDYDGYSTRSAKRMKGLVDELKNMAASSLNHEPHWYTSLTPELKNKLKIKR